MLTHFYPIIEHDHSFWHSFCLSVTCLVLLATVCAVVMKDLTCTEQNNPNKKWSLAKNPPKPPESMLLCWGLDFDLPVLIFFFSVCSFHLPFCGPTEATSFVPEFCFGYFLNRDMGFV